MEKVAAVKAVDGHLVETIPEIEPIVAFKTADGLIFEDEMLALRHEFHIRLYTALDTQLNKYVRSFPPSLNEITNAVIAFLVQEKLIQ